MQKPAFSTIELMVTIIVIMIIMASLVPSITKKLNTRSVNIGGTIGTSNSNIEFEPDCSHINSDCELCTIDTCMLCLKICPTGQYAQTSDCTCKPCSDIFSSDCIACTNKKCKKCDSDTKYIDNNTCTICPIGSYCDSINKITCEEGKYTDTEGQTSCIDCEIGYKCTGGIKTPCEAGYYNSSTNQSSCLPCEKGYKCEGAKDKIQCTGNQYQDETTQSTCKTCATEGYYITDDRSSCTICEAGYFCPGNGTKTQCPAGTYSQAGAKECIPCAKGTYSTAVGATSISTCQSCPAGKYNNTTGATSCTNCSAGYYSSAGATTCTICSAGTYSTTEGSSTCTTCPKGYYCTGGSNKTSCGAGKYLDTTGNDASSDCKTCASKTANCSACDLTTGACSACAGGYQFKDGACVELPCGNLAMEISLTSSKKICMTKFNIGQDAKNYYTEQGKTEIATEAEAFVIPSTVAKVVTAGSGSCSPSSSRKCCWEGTTSTKCDAANGGYSGCTRTVCDWRAAKAICSNLNYLNKSWHVPTGSEWSKIGSKISTVSKGVGEAGLMLCDGSSGYSSARCYDSSRCSGAYEGTCVPWYYWSSSIVSEGQSYDYLLSQGVIHESDENYAYAFSVRCVANL